MNVEPIFWVWLGGSGIAFSIIYYVLVILLWEKNEGLSTLIFWFLFPLGLVALLFGLFDNAIETGDFMGYKISGALAGYVLLFTLGYKNSEKLVPLDKELTKNKALGEQVAELEDELLRLKKPAKVLNITEYFNYKIKGTKKEINLVAGDMANVKGVHIWVNTENTNMLMARYYENSISGLIRYLGAKKNDDDGYVDHDLIADELRGKMDKIKAVAPGTVVVTGSGELKKTHGVKRIFHVASVYGQVGVGYNVIQGVEQCVKNVLAKADEEKIKDANCMLIPLLGTGRGGGKVEAVMGKLFEVAYSYLKSNPDSVIDKIYFLMYTDQQLDIGKAILENHVDIVKK